MLPLTLTLTLKGIRVVLDQGVFVLIYVSNRGTNGSELTVERISPQNLWEHGYIPLPANPDISLFLIAHLTLIVQINECVEIMGLPVWTVFELFELLIRHKKAHALFDCPSKTLSTLPRLPAKIMESNMESRVPRLLYNVSRAII